MTRCWGHVWQDPLQIEKIKIFNVYICIKLQLEERQGQKAGIVMKRFSLLPLSSFAVDGGERYLVLKCHTEGIRVLSLPNQGL